MLPNKYYLRDLKKFAFSPCAYIYTFIFAENNTIYRSLS